jgi:YHS domain-containing protein
MPLLSIPTAISAPASALGAWRSAALWSLAALAILLSGCSAMVAQNPSSALKPVNAVAMEGDSRVMLQGADVVAYFTQGRYVKGSTQFKSTHQEVVFHFASAEHKALFDAEPARYLPQFGGYCANGIVYAIPWGGDADAWRIIDGKLYIFGGAGSRDAFLLDVPGNRKLAEGYWANEVSGRNSFWQRGKRLVMRVPHYKSGEELARLVAEAKARKP